MKSNLQKLKKRLDKAVKRINEELKTNDEACTAVYSDVHSKSQLNDIVVLLERLGYRHDNCRRNHTKEWDCYYSQRHGKPNMGISVIPRSKIYMVLNWKPSECRREKGNVIKMN